MLKILTGKQIKEADSYTIKHEPISSLDLMERASMRIADYIADKYPRRTELVFFLGKGNNGGDGLVVARLLSQRKFKCHVVYLFDIKDATEEYRANFGILPKEVTTEKFSEETAVSPRMVIIDALLGNGIKGEIHAPVSDTIDFINSSGCEVISIDMPSGMTTEFGNAGQKMVRASTTLTLEFPKLSLLLPEAGEYAGEMAILPIGLDKGFINTAESPYRFITGSGITENTKKRGKFAHKGTFGNALLICGSKGMMGAAVLSVSAALRSGCGLTTAHVPSCGADIIHTTNPSAIVDADKEDCFSVLPADTAKYSAVGIGCGLGTAPESVDGLRKLLEVYRRPMVFDADALNILAADSGLLKNIPEKSILTPHIGELKRLVGEWSSDEEKLSKASNFAATYNIILVVKGAYTMICSPDGRIFFNSTGNPGMAKGGSGDVLTGLITGFLTKGLDPLTAAIEGVYIHGKAGDDAALARGEEAMNSSDIIEFL